jgi:PTS system nitrogen regulatory IIA component
MQYTVQDAARMLNVSEETVYHWIREEHFPAVQFNDRYHVNSQRLIEWAHERQIPLQISGGAGLPTLEAALAAGEILPEVRATGKREALQDMVARMNLPEGVERAFLFEMVWAREQLGSTGFGKGIAIPHARRPIMLPTQTPRLVVGYPEKAVDFGAADGEPVHTIFLLVTPAIRVHLHLLARLGYVLQDGTLGRLIQARAGQEELLSRLRVLEEAVRK